MKQINVYFDDYEYKKLIEKKGAKSWHDFIVLLIKSEGNNDAPS